MYLWNYHALTAQLKKGPLTHKEKFKYLLAIMLYIPTGFMGSQWLSGIYRLVYEITNTYARKIATQIPPIKIFTDYNYATDIGLICILIIGTLVCYAANQSDGKHFFERFMALSVPITIRMSIYFLSLFLVGLSITLVYYNYKLQGIASLGNGFLKVFKKLRHLKELAPVMDFVSHRMHIFACILSLCSMVTNFIVLSRQMRTISNKN